MFMRCDLGGLPPLPPHMPFLNIRPNRLRCQSHRMCLVDTDLRWLVCTHPESERKGRLRVLQPSAAHRDKGSARWPCWRRCWGAAPGRASAPAPPGARTLAPGPLHLGCDRTARRWRRDTQERGGAAGSSHSRPSSSRQPRSLCRLAPAVMLCTGRAGSSRPELWWTEPHLSVVFTPLAYWWMPYVLNVCRRICLKW